MPLTPTAADRLKICNLSVHFDTPEGYVYAVDGVNLCIPAGQIVGLIGESGSGKSVLARSILKLLPPKLARIQSQGIFYQQQQQTIDLQQLGNNSPQLRSIRGNEISMIFQEPINAFGPLHTIGNQITEVILVHEKVSKREARDRSVSLLQEVGIASPEKRFHLYPHQLSGGMLQRAMIAMALVCNPRLLIADEPTTAVDVTIQAQIIDLLLRLQAERQMSILLISHNLALIAELADRVEVMYLGKIVESGLTEDIVGRPSHPYTQALWRAIPLIDRPAGRLSTIPGSIPNPFQKLELCPFLGRCGDATASCRQHPPPRVQLSGQHTVSCLLHQQPIGQSGRDLGRVR